MEAKIPNIDNMPDEELHDVRRALSLLARYADTSISARYLRSKGEVDEALRLEQAMEIIYSGLPDWARW